MPALFCSQCQASLVQCDKDRTVYCSGHEKVCPDCGGAARMILGTLSAEDRTELRARGVLR